MQKIMFLHDLHVKFTFLFTQHIYVLKLEFFHALKKSPKLHLSTKSRPFGKTSK